MLVIAQIKIDNNLPPKICWKNIVNLHYLNIIILFFNIFIRILIPTPSPTHFFFFFIVFSFRFFSATFRTNPSPFVFFFYPLSIFLHTVSHTYTLLHLNLFYSFLFLKIQPFTHVFYKELATPLRFPTSHLPIEKHCGLR